jgi:DnaK suppressor protein
MLDKAKLNSFKKRLEELREEIMAFTETRKDMSSTVELDQTRTGRLSRMDALQQQEMARAGQIRAESELSRINAALARIEDGSFGECVVCGDDILEGRLQANPAVTLCIMCAEKRERGQDTT